MTLSSTARSRTCGVARAHVSESRPLQLMAKSGDDSISCPVGGTRRKGQNLEHPALSVRFRGDIAVSAQNSAERELEASLKAQAPMIRLSDNKYVHSIYSPSNENKLDLGFSAYSKQVNGMKIHFLFFQ